MQCNSRIVRWLFLGQSAEGDEQRSRSSFAETNGESYRTHTKKPEESMLKTEQVNQTRSIRYVVGSALAEEVTVRGGLRVLRREADGLFSELAIEDLD
mmetsp:Transcript_20590/g.29855  ORF Transcript_20590/g.29855 Transcript_20590/m.29855 type:complete len:98 (-) Transcript_20590:352-645(-)